MARHANVSPKVPKKKQDAYISIRRWLIGCVVRPVVRRGTVHMSRTRAQAGSRVVIQRPCSGTGSFHRLVQFIVTFDPSKVASLLVGGLPGESSELLKGHRSF